MSCFRAFAFGDQPSAPVLPVAAGSPLGLGG